MSQPPTGGIVFQTWGGGPTVLHDVLPAWAVAAFAVLTHLGDWWLLLVLVSLAYLAYDRRAGGFVAATLFVGFAVTIGLKAWFAYPRPPAEFAHVVALGYAFPSGHALGSTVGWGGLAVVLERVSTVRRRAAVAGIVIVTVALSRVAIGVHYLIDVVAGVAIGLVLLALATRWAGDAPRVLFGVAAVLALAAAVISGGAITAYALAGGSIGALAAWPVAVPSDQLEGRHDIAVIAAVGALLAGALAVVYPTGMLAFVSGALATVAVLIGPVVRDRWLDRGVAREQAQG